MGVHGCVTRSGIAALIVIACLVAACDASRDGTDGISLEGMAVAGPACPVVTQPPDPACDDRPVSGAEILVRNEAGESVARVWTADDGSFSVSVAPGRYELLAQVVDGLLGTPAPVVVAGVDPEPVVVAYDTGIR